MVQIPFYKMREDGRLECSTNSTTTTLSYTDTKLTSLEGIGTISGNITDDQKTIINKYVTETYGADAVVTDWGSDNNNNVTIKTGGTWVEVANNNNNYSTDEAASLSTEGTSCRFRSYATKIVVPTNMTFGFYIDQYADKTQNYMYSYDAWNEAYRDKENGISNTLYNKNHKDNYSDYTFCATFQPSVKGTGIDYYLCFEDWPNQTRDLCDVVLAFSATPDTYSIVDEESQSWILAAEDMGSIGDFDFNDLVVKVSHVSGKEEVTITPLAAGGTLPLYFYHKNDSGTDDGTDDGKLTGEFHSWFGNGNISSGTMINTSSISTSGITKTIKLSTDFSMTTNSYINESDGTSKMGNFGIKVTKDGTTTTEVTAPGKGEAPQMICVPASWHWPKERVNITEAYAGDSNGDNSFKAWAKDKKSVDWCGYPQSDLVLPTISTGN